MATIDRLIADLRAEGSLDSQGQFTLDREQARAKMQKFQLVDARRYVLELVQAAVLREATHMVFDIDADDMRMHFDGAPFLATEIDDLYGSLFTDGDSRRLRGVRQLAIALNAALGMDPKYIHLRSGTIELRMRPGQPDEIITHEQAWPRTELHVRQRLRARVLFDFLRNLSGRMVEEQYLRARCLFSTVPVTLEGKQLSFGLEGDEQGLARLPIAGEDFRGFMTVVDRPGPCELRLVKDGVWIDSRELPECGTHLLAVVESDKLRKDVSQAKIVADATLERIELALHQLRWKLWKRAAEQHEGWAGERVAAMIREQLLGSASLQELQEVDEARELSAALTWPDCRGGSRVSLRQLVELAAADEPVMYSPTEFPELVAQGAPIPWIASGREVVLLERMLEWRLESAECVLERERRRERGRLAWRARVGKPQLPTHIGFMVRHPIAVQLASGPLRGELGIDLMPLARHENKAPLHLFMFKDGCLLGRTELALDLPGLWMAIEAPFEPNEDYSDALRSDAFVPILLHALAGFAAPLAQLLQRSANHDEWAPLVPSIRGLVKRWLNWLVDPQRQSALLLRAGVDEEAGQVAASELLPGLLEGQSPLAHVPLFEQLTGPRLSLVQLAELVRTRGQIHHVDERPEDSRLLALDVLVTGPGDRKILRGLFGPQRLAQWDFGPKQRELEFWARNREELAATRADAKALLAEAGIAFEDWLLDLPPGYTRGFVTVFIAEELSESELDLLSLAVRHEGRLLCGLSLKSCFGPLLAVVEHPGLRPTERWDDVVRDAAFEQVLAAVHAASRELFRLGCASLERVPANPRRSLARMLLHGAARDPELRSLAEHAPLLTTVDGRTLSLARAAELTAGRDKLGFVSPDIGYVEVSDPPIIAVEDAELDELRSLLGDVFVDASDRVRHHRVYDLLESRPALHEAKLDPSETLVRLPIQAGGQRGEIGLSSVHSDPGLTLRLGVAGREVDSIYNDHGIALPLDAIVIDDELPLDARGQVLTQSKRIKALVRLCRRRVPELILRLCQRWPGLREHERAIAWSLLLQHLVSEAKQQRRTIREQAFAAAAQVPGFRDICGQRRSLADLLAHAGPIEVLIGERHRAQTLELPTLVRPIVLAAPDELECLRLYREVRVLDEGWEETLASLQALAQAPKVESPKVQQVAIAYRRATAAGGLDCELWIPRAGSLLEFTPELIVAQAGRELTRERPLAALPSAGILRGDALVLSRGQLLLDERQLAGLERQLMIMYTELATRLADNKLAAADRPRAIEYLSWAADNLELLPSQGKHVEALRRALDRAIPPSLRARMNDAFAQQQPEPSTPEPSAPEPSPAIDQASKHWRTVPSSPEQRLLAAVYEQLDWARKRHRLLEELLLNHLELRTGLGEQLAQRDRAGLALNREHPIVARLLGQDSHDPIDLAFLLAALYSLLNYDSEAISDDDEREFVAQLVSRVC